MQMTSTTSSKALATVSNASTASAVPTASTTHIADPGPSNIFDNSTTTETASLGSSLPKELGGK